MTPFWMLTAVGRKANPAWRVLDVGCGHGNRSQWFVSQGCAVTGIDIESYAESCASNGIKFILSSLEDFRTDQKFDIILAAYVLPFVKCAWDERIAHLLRLANPQALVLLTVFGPEDDWARNPNVAIIAKDELLALLARHKLSALYKSHEQYKAPPARGPVKTWDVFGVLAEYGPG